MTMNDHKINSQIKAHEGLVVDQNGANLGKMPIEKVIELAQEYDADIVQVNDSPIVFRIMKYEKYLYETKKKQKLQRKTKHSEVIKEVKFTPQIGEHDILVKVKKIKEFLEDGYRVKITMFVHNKRMSFKDVGIEVIKNVYERICGQVASSYMFKDTGNFISTIIAPTSKNNNYEKELRGNKTDTSQKDERNEPARFF